MNRERWEIRKSEDGQFYAVLLANNNRIICTTEIMHRRRILCSSEGGRNERPSSCYFKWLNGKSRRLLELAGRDRESLT